MGSTQAVSSGALASGTSSSRSSSRRKTVSRSRPPGPGQEPGRGDGRPNGAGADAGWLGAELASGPRLTVASVKEGSPAWAAGLQAEDELVAEDGFRVDRAGLWDRLCQEGPAGTLRLSLFRRDELLEVTVPLAAAPEDTAWVEPIPDAPAEARAAFEAWCGAAFPL